MIITNVNAGPKASYSASGTNLTVGTVTVDLQARQSDEQKVLYICLDNQLKTMAEGIGAWYVAIVVIPPKQYDLVDSGQQDANGNSVMTRVDRSLDMANVELRLWGLPEGYGQEESVGGDN